MSSSAGDVSSSSRESSSPQASDSQEEDEGEDSYKPGGYHRVAINDSIGQWRIVQKLGWGHFSTVWLAQQKSQDNTKQFAALKVCFFLRAPISRIVCGVQGRAKKFTRLLYAKIITQVQKSAEHYTQAAKDEIMLLEMMNHTPIEETGRLFVVRLIESLMHEGPYGVHAVLAFEVLGDNLLTLIKHWNYQGIPYALTRQISHQVCMGLDYLHRVAGIIHTDLKPENVLIAGLRGSRAVKLQTSLPAIGALQTARGICTVSPLDVIKTKIRLCEEQLVSADPAGKKKLQKKVWLASFSVFFFSCAALNIENKVWGKK